MIEIDHIEKSFKDKKVLKDVSLHIEEGEIFGIIGRSGAGKSTLLRCINGLESIQSGEIRVDHRSIEKLDERELRDARRDMGMIFQHFSLLERKSVYENIALPLECHGVPKEEQRRRIEELMDLVEITPERNKRPRELSGGQKQRVAIARALATKPRILLSDEATSALDPKTTGAILELLRRINEEFRLTIVLVTHQMEVIKEVCSRTAIMEDGRVLEVGATEDLFLHSPLSLRKLLGEEKLLLPDRGVNLRLLFPKERSHEAVITAMARSLHIDISIISGRLENFRGNILGSLIINVPEGSAHSVRQYLQDQNINYQEVQNEY